MMKDANHEKETVRLTRRVAKRLYIIIDRKLPKCDNGVGGDMVIGC